MGSCVTELWLMTQPSEVNPISQQHSAINISNVKTLDLLEFLVMLLFCSYPKIICRKLQDYENMHEGNSFLIT